MTRLSYTDRTHAGIEDVWAVLIDHAAMSSWLSRTWRSRLVRRGTPAPNGVGAVRGILTLGGPVQEEIVAYDEPHHVSYRMVKGAPVIRHYRGEVALSETESGTRVVWTLTFEAWPSWLEPVISRVVHIATAGCAHDLVRAAEKGITDVGSGPAKSAE
jgi:uncharacterized protein YndB with AHSA1/START domain